jgi:anaerobic ribonucleoside-triphosphate reductase
VKAVPPISQVPLEDHERQPCEVWTRVMGYHRPASSFNIGKKGEYEERRYFRERRGET